MRGAVDRLGTIRYRVGWLLLAIIAAAGVTWSADPAPIASDRFDTAIGHASRSLDRYIRSNSIPGLSVSVAVEGEIVFSGGFGSADLENRVPVSPRTRFRIGSVSKPFASLLLAMLVEEGCIELDAVVQEYVPDFPRKRWPVTIRQLATHLAGIRHYEGMEYLSNGFPSIREGLAVFADDPLVVEPDTEFHYSSYGYNLLGVALEAACEQSYESCLELWVLQPLQLASTTVERPQRIIPHRARPYQLNDEGAMVNAHPHDLLYKLPAGGLLSTTDDLVVFGSAHLAPGVLSEEVRDLLFSPQRDRAGEEIGFGLGWVIDEDPAGRRVWAHLGGSVGGSCALLIYPDSGLVVAIAANRDPGMMVEPAVAVAQLFLEAVEQGS